MGLEVPKDLTAIGRLLRGERPKSWGPRGRATWTIHAKTESGEVDYEKLLFFPLPGMKALYSALGLEVIVTLLSRWPLQPKPAGPGAIFKPTPFKSDEAVEAFETVTITIKGCTTKGVGLGLDPQNVVDMLVPGQAAADVLRIGDRVILWNSDILWNPSTGAQKKLISVVDASLDTHAVIVERPLQPLTAAEQTALILEATRRSRCEVDGCEAGEVAGLEKRAPAPEKAPDAAFAAVEEALAGQGLEVSTPKAALEKLFEETKVVE
jgi:hypothetical protein